MIEFGVIVSGLIGFALGWLSGAHYVYQNYPAIARRVLQLIERSRAEQKPETWGEETPNPCPVCGGLKAYGHRAGCRLGTMLDILGDSMAESSGKENSA